MVEQVEPRIRDLLSELDGLIRAGDDFQELLDQVKKELEDWWLYDEVFPCDSAFDVYPPNSWKLTKKELEDYVYEPEITEAALRKAARTYALGHFGPECDEFYSVLAISVNKAEPGSALIAYFAMPSGQAGLLPEYFGLFRDLDEIEAELRVQGYLIKEDINEDIYAMDDEQIMALMCE